MKIGLVGLGRMGAGIAERLRREGHEVVGYDRDQTLSDAASLEELVAGLATPRVVCVMVPAGAPTDATLRELADLSSKDDIVIDGGNSYYKDSMRRALTLADRGIQFLDVGTSGGIWGLGAASASWLEGPAKRSQLLSRSSRRLLPKVVTRTSAHRVPATSSRWCTTGSSMACCRRTPRASTCCRPRSST
jgi:6-phosphogluconate dehydrogenase